MLDINLLRADKGGNPELVRESLRKRFAKVDLVDEVIDLDQAWRTSKSLLPKPLSILADPRPVCDPRDPRRCRAVRTGQNPPGA
jgi:hypothetical protein